MDSSSASPFDKANFDAALKIRRAIEHQVAYAELAYGNFCATKFDGAKREMAKYLSERFDMLRTLIAPTEFKEIMVQIVSMIEEAVSRIERRHYRFEHGRPSHISEQMWEVMWRREEEKRIEQFDAVWGEDD